MKINVYQIENILVREEIFTTKFTCDLEKCKGACCTLESEFGAPLIKNEIELIEESLPATIEYLDSEKKDYIKENNFWEIKEEIFLVKSIDNKDCVFVFRENGIAKCALEKAFFNNKSKFRKPISCHLFPIRITDFGGEILRYEEFSECVPALEKGKETNINIAEFCKDGLERAYGKKWYSKLVNNDR